MSLKDSKYKGRASLNRRRVLHEMELELKDNHLSNKKDPEIAMRFLNPVDHVSYIFDCSSFLDMKSNLNKLNCHLIETNYRLKNPIGFLRIYYEKILDKVFKFIPE
jgi:hypothetical protein